MVLPTVGWGFPRQLIETLSHKHGHSSIPCSQSFTETLFPVILGCVKSAISLTRGHWNNREITPGFLWSRRRRKFRGQFSLLWYNIYILIMWGEPFKATAKIWRWRYLLRALWLTWGETSGTRELTRAGRQTWAHSGLIICAAVLKPSHTHYTPCLLIPHSKNIKDSKATKLLE